MGPRGCWDCELPRVFVVTSDLTLIPQDSQYSTNLGPAPRTQVWEGLQGLRSRFTLLLDIAEGDDLSTDAYTHAHRLTGDTMPHRLGLALDKPTLLKPENEFSSFPVSWITGIGHSQVGVRLLRSPE